MFGEDFSAIVGEGYR